MTDRPTSMSRMNQVIEEATRDIHEHRDRLENPVIAMSETLQHQIRDFESRLKPDEAIALWLVSFGPSLVFHADNIRFAKPGIVIFEGVTEEGEAMELVQHHSQLNVLFKAVKRKDGEEKRPIGFIWDPAE